jgi:hypothetical protein
VRRVAVGVLLVGVVLAACGGESEPAGPTATVPQATSTTNPYAVPPVIDEAYVNRVLAGLDQVVGDAVRALVDTSVLDEGVYYRLRAVALDAVFQRKLDDLQDDLLTGMAGYRRPPGDKITTVRKLITVRDACIFAEVLKDFSAVNDDGASNESTQWVALVPLDPARDLHDYNPTPWVYLYDGFRPDQSMPADQCAS